MLLSGVSPQFVVPQRVFDIGIFAPGKLLICQLSHEVHNSPIEIEVFTSIVCEDRQSGEVFHWSGISSEGGQYELGLKIQ